MPEHESRSLDVLGIKPVADAFSHITKATVDGASAFLGRICLPAAEEFGLLFQDQVRSWRKANAVRVVAAAQAHSEKYLSNQESQAHPRLVAAVLDHGSWSDDETLQQMWGGLLFSSCSEDGRDDSNLISVNLLSQLTALQVSVIAYGCQKCEKTITPSGLMMPQQGEFCVDFFMLQSVAGTEDIHRIDRELDHLASLGLLQGGIYSDSDALTVDITPSALALNLYVRCQGFHGSPVEFFGLTMPIQQV